MERFLLAFVLSMSLLYVNAQDPLKPLTLKYNTHVNLKNLNQPGMPLRFTQLCTTELDSVIRTGNILFKTATLRNVSECSYEMQIRNDTLCKLIITTATNKNTKQLIKDMNLSHGKPLITNNRRHYIWHNRSVPMTDAILEINKVSHTAILTVVPTHK